MTIGTKITNLRQAAGLSQEQLAERLNVSRQSVSKWEMDQSLPQPDKIVQLCALFRISTDTLLLETPVIPPEPIRIPLTHKYFGTDGFRGEANEALTSMHAYKIGRFLGWYFASPLSGCEQNGYRPRIVIGKDTRRSSYMLEYSLVAGLTASGADAYMLHVTTTPSISYVARQDGFDCGIMITASHNPYYDNGIKLVNGFGEKADDTLIALIEAYLDGNTASLGICGDLPFAKRERIGCIHDYVSGRNRYIGYLISLASHSYKDLRIGLDCANGAAWNIARAVFGALGAQMHILSAEPDGLNVNLNCGATDTARLQQLVREKHLDMGFAFDGDADRCIAVDEAGNVLDGDAILYVLAGRLQRQGNLTNNSVVATHMSNSGFAQSLEKRGIGCVRTEVGDKFVYDCMQKNDYCLGGEISGHIIVKKYATTGDGLLTAILLAEEVCDTKRSLSALTESLHRFAQYTVSVPVEDKDTVLCDEGVSTLLARTQQELAGKGRALLRRSGTEQVIRVMVECEDAAACPRYAERLAAALGKANQSKHE